MQINASPFFVYNTNIRSIMYETSNPGEPDRRILEEETHTYGAGIDLPRKIYVLNRLRHFGFCRRKIRMLCENITANKLLNTYE